MIAYDGVPESDGSGEAGFIHTDDGALIAGEPDVAATWFPVNDHPSDRRRYSFRITVPRGLEAIANGELVGVDAPRRARSIWQLGGARADGAVSRDGLDRRSSSCAPTRSTGSSTGTRSTPTCSREPKPRTGAPLRADRDRRSRPTSGCTRTIDVPAGGATLSFWVHRDTEPAPTTSSSRRARPAARTGRRCPTARATPPGSPASTACATLKLHPFLRHYQTAGSAATAARAGRRAPGGRPAARTGLRALDRRPRALRRALRRGLADVRQRRGCAVRRRLRRRHQRLERPRLDLVRGRRGPARRLDGPGRAGRQPGQPERLVRRHGRSRRRRASARPPRRRSPASPRSSSSCPASSARIRSRPRGSIVDDVRDLGFALENQTRPIYSPAFFEDAAGEENERVVVHELAHQWVGDSLPLRLAQHLAQRGLRVLRRVDMERAPGQDDRAGSSSTPTRARRPPHRAGSSRSATRARTAARLTDLHARRDDPARAAQADRRRGVLPPPAPLDHAPRAARVDRPVHRARRAHLGQAARHVLPHLALHAAQAGGHHARRRTRRAVHGRRRSGIVGSSSSTVSSRTSSVPRSLRPRST